MKEPAWKHDEVFPIIGRIISEEYEHHHRHVTAREIAARLLADAEARAMIEAAQRQQPDWSLEHTASNMVAWFKPAHYGGRVGVAAGVRSHKD